MNYAEELAYWYLRLNGFFPITNFVLHRLNQSQITNPNEIPRDPSDCDVLAVRPPHVQERIGGNDDDWDPQISRHFEASQMLGVICEVKAGEYTKAVVLKSENVEYAFKRIGFTSQIDPYRSFFDQNADAKQVMIGDTYKVMKLLICNIAPSEPQHFYYLTLKHIHAFIENRIRKYQEKRSDWVYFNSSLMQEIIWKVQIETNYWSSRR